MGDLVARHVLRTRRIYLETEEKLEWPLRHRFMDYHATTPVDPRVLEAMLPYFNEPSGNSAGRNHAFGWTAEEAVENARAQIARLINATPKEIIFTSGATKVKIIWR